MAQLENFGNWKTYRRIAVYALRNCTTHTQTHRHTDARTPKIKCNSTEQRICFRIVRLFSLQKERKKNIFSVVSTFLRFISSGTWTQQCKRVAFESNAREMECFRSACMSIYVCMSMELSWMTETTKAPRHRDLDAKNSHVRRLVATYLAHSARIRCTSKLEY